MYQISRLCYFCHVKFHNVKCSTWPPSLPTRENCPFLYFTIYNIVEPFAETLLLWNLAFLLRSSLLTSQRKSQRKLNCASSAKQIFWKLRHFHVQATILRIQVSFRYLIAVGFTSLTVCKMSTSITSYQISLSCTHQKYWCFQHSFLQKICRTLF